MYRVHQPEIVIEAVDKRGAVKSFSKNHYRAITY